MTFSFKKTEERNIVSFMKILQCGQFIVASHRLGKMNGERQHGKVQPPFQCGEVA
jgi:hypothetical protein